MEANQPPVIAISRRKFFARILILVGAVFSGSALYVIGRYLFPKGKEEPAVTSMVAARVGEIAPDTAKLFKFNGKPTYLIHLKNDQYEALSGVCTHLGCTVQFDAPNSTPGGFHCNCHGGRYDITGKNISGPPPKPLQPYRVSVKDNNIIVSIV